MKLALTALAALTVAVAPLPAAAQDAAQPSPAAAAASPGVLVAEVAAWLTSQGLTVEPARQEGDQTYLRVRDGRLNWLLFFFSCQNDRCPDIQFSAGYANPKATVDNVNAWNTGRRFLKAFYRPDAQGGAGAGVVQFDVLTTGQGAAQLADPLAVWRGLLPAFAEQMGAVTLSGGTEPAPTSPPA